MLREEEAFSTKVLEAVVENTNAQLAYLDADMNFIMANDAYVAGSGHTRDELIGRNHFELFPNKENEAIFKRVRDTGERIEYRAKPFEYVNQPWRGVTYWDWILVPIKDNAGKVTGLVYSLVDVTESIRSKELSDALNNIHTLINSTLDYTEVKKLAVVKAREAIRCESAAMLIYQNHRWVVDDVYGYPTNFVGSTFTDEEVNSSFFTIDKKQPTIINDTYSNQRVNHEIMRRYKIRSLLCVPLVIKEEIIGCLLFSSNTEPLAFTNIQVDFAIKLGYSISLAIENARLFEAVERRAQELSEHRNNLEVIIQQRTKEISDINSLLRQSEAQHRQLIQVSPDAYFVYAKNRIVYANPAALRLFGYKKLEEIDPTIISNIILESELTILPTGSDQSQQPVHLGELMIKKEAGLPPVVVDVTVVPVVFYGEIANQYIVRDVTRRKELEKEMARLDRLNLVGEMAAGIGHEVRNPMTSVRGFLQLLHNKESDTNKLKYYDIMIEELDRANSIISEYLSLAKDRSVKFSSVSLNSIINSLYPLLSADAIKQDKSIVLKKDDTPTILLNEKEIRQLIINLVRNGLEAMPSGGTLTIGTFEKDDEVELFVEDEGAGIKPEVFEKLGTPFVTTKTNGTGLGLSVCYSIAHKHNAKIEVKTSSAGTIFYVRFKK